MSTTRTEQLRKAQRDYALRQEAAGRKQLKITPYPLKEHHSVLRLVAKNLDDGLFDKSELEAFLKKGVVE